MLQVNLLPFHQSIRKRFFKNPKFYFFDTGVKRALERKLHIPVHPATSEYGKLFEEFIITEVFRLNHYYKADYSLSYICTKDQVEVDLIIERPGSPLFLIEIKSKEKISIDDTRQLKNISKDLTNAKPFIWSNDPISKIINGVECVPWREGLKHVFS